MLIVIGVLVTLTLASLMAAEPAYAAVTCGGTITSDATLTADLTCTTGTGITVGAGSITLDCAGHTITGPGVGSSDYGIHVRNQGVVTMKNCVLKNWRLGLYCEAHCRFNTFIGNTATGDGNGFDFYSDSGQNTLSDNTASGNTGIGFYFEVDSGVVTLTHNIATGNKDGFEWRYTSGGNTLTGNSASENTENGFYFTQTSSGNTLEGNTASSNGQNGFYFLAPRMETPLPPVTLPETTT